MALFIFDLQHLGREGTSREGDFGAAGDLDGDGKKEAWEQEAVLTPRYVAAVSQRLAVAADSRHRMLVLNTGSYESRARRAQTLAELYRERGGRRVAYIACHLNAGGGRYAAAFYRAGTSSDLAVSLCGSLGRLPGIDQANPLACSSNSWAAPWSCLRHVSPSIDAVCLEPAFLDTPEHLPLLRGDQAQLGEAILRGLMDWAGGAHP